MLYDLMMVVPENETGKSAWLKNLPFHIFSKYGKCIVENKFTLLYCISKQAKMGRKGGCEVQSPPPPNHLFEFFHF
jgi:hypothetical protein